MNIKEYSEAALKTAIYDKTGYMGIVYPTLGFIGELCETYTKLQSITFRESPIDQETVLDLRKEIGDVCWYINAFATAIGSSLEEINKEYNQLSLFDSPQVEPIMLMGLVAELVKKGWRDEQGNISDVRKEKIKQVLINAWYLLNTLTENVATNMETVLQMNVDKLTSRQKRNQLTGDGDNR